MVTIQIFADFSARNEAKMAVLIWTISMAAAHICIAAVFIWKLRRTKSAFKGTKSLIQGLTIQTIQTGSAANVVSIVTFLSYIIKNDSNVITACCYLIGPLYYLSALLYSRQYDAISGTGRSTPEGNNVNAIAEVDGIHKGHLPRTATVTVDYAAELADGPDAGG
ncbi:hypothetical protein B0H17DRAFT_1202299 [Mycena rosella]|uniref:DUF6534 domain-containing protein n=1 Tax=Mycena rosella TaxID=1033263 RepID=A0AAD7DH20_MYCRO|nr:hypothetical protein B0H17DRAFT_1202299 [Mycena rosella]